MHCYTQCPQTCSRPLPTHASPGDSWILTGKSESVSCGVSAPFSWSWCAQGSVWALQTRIYFPVLCKFWQLCGGVNGNLLQEGLCHTQVCCTQSPCPCGSPLLTCTSTEDAQTQFYLSLCGVPGSWCAQGLFEPSEHLWHNWGLILNTNLPLLPSCWGFSFALGYRVSPHSQSSAYHLTGVSLTLEVEYFKMAGPEKHTRCSRSWTCIIYSQLLQRSAGAAPGLGRGVSILSHSSAMQPPRTAPALHR